MQLQQTLIISEADLRPFLEQVEKVTHSPVTLEIETMTARLTPEGWRLDCGLRDKQKTLDEMKQELIDGALTKEALNDDPTPQAKT